MIPREAGILEKIYEKNKSISSNKIHQVFPYILLDLLPDKKDQRGDGRLEGDIQ